MRAAPARALRARERGCAAGAAALRRLGVSVAGQSA